MVSIATRGDRTLYFDYLPLELGQVQGMNTTFQLYTVPGQIYYNNTRKLVLQGVDGIVFVADSSSTKVEENRESFRNLIENLQAIGHSINDIPVVLQYNKRDLPDALPVNELDAQLNAKRLATFEAVAKDGQGVFVTLKEIGRQVIERINTNQSEPRRRTGNAVPKEIKRSSDPSSRHVAKAKPIVPQSTTPLTNPRPGEITGATKVSSPQATTPLTSPRPQPSNPQATREQMPRKRPMPQTAGIKGKQAPKSFQDVAAQNAPTRQSIPNQRNTGQIRKTVHKNSDQATTTAQSPLSNAISTKISPLP